MVKKKVSKKKANKSSNNFNRNLLIGAVIIILIFVVAFNFAGKGFDEEGLAQMGMGDGGPGNLKPFKDIKEFNDLCPIHKMADQYQNPSYDCDDYAATAALCAYVQGHSACMIWEKMIHYINVIEIESDKPDKSKFCVVEPQTGKIRTTQTGCKTGCWYQGKNEKKPLKKEAGSCLKSSEVIICDHSEMIWHATDPYCSLKNPYYCELMEDRDICIDKIQDILEKTEPYNPYGSEEIHEMPTKKTKKWRRRRR
tara:strand:- start:31 stop:789 length:759 start_codon:yes stop_codon:yes gene_type:complete